MGPRGRGTSLARHLCYGTRPAGARAGPNPPWQWLAPCGAMRYVSAYQGISGPRGGRAKGGDMSRAGQQGVTPSILDRLIDPESAGTEWRHGYGIDQLLEVVRRDLEDLLNTRQS